MQLTRRIRIHRLSADRLLVVNAITGNLLVVNDAAYRQMQALRDGRPHECRPAVLRALRENRLAFRSEAEEDEAFREVVTRAFERDRRDARPEYCFAVNTHCNFACVYCFEPEELRASAATLTEDQLDAAFRVIDDREATRQGSPPEFTLYGGEPLLVPARPVVESILRRVAARGHTVNIITNGHTLDHFLDLLDDFDPVIGSVQITLDGVAAQHDRRRVLRGGAGTFARIAANIDAFLNRGGRAGLSLRTSLDAANLHEIPALVRLLDERGWSSNPRVSVFPVTIQDHRPAQGHGPTQDHRPDGRSEGLVSHRDLLDATLAYSTDVGGGPFDLSGIQALGQVRGILGAAASGRSPGRFSPRATFCGGTAGRLLVFHPDGHVYPCYEVIGRPDVAVGRYHPERRPDPDAERRWSGARILRQPDCFVCPISTFCGGGCASGALAGKGTTDGSYCEGALEVFDRYLELVAEEYRRAADHPGAGHPRHVDV